MQTTHHSIFGRDRGELGVAGRSFESSTNKVRAKRPSSPVGCSGGKKRCGRSHDPSLSSFMAGLQELRESFEVEDGSVGVQSMASSSSPSSSAIRSGDESPAFAERSDGKPKIGLDAVGMMGVEDSVREVSKSGSADGLGAGDERALVCGEGVSEGNLCPFVSKRRILGGCRKRST